MKNILIFILLLFLTYFLTSCKTQTKVVEITKIDTIYKKEIIKIDRPQLNSIIIENICDSLTGLKLINYTNTSNNVQTTLKSVNNSLIFEVNTDSIVNSKIELFKSTYKGESIKETIRVKYIPKWVYYNLIISILAIGYIFRKPIFRLINPIKL